MAQVKCSGGGTSNINTHTRSHHPLLKDKFSSTATTTLALSASCIQLLQASKHQWFHATSVFEPDRGLRDIGTFFLFQCRTKINHPRHHVATKYEMSRV